MSEGEVEVDSLDGDAGKTTRDLSSLVANSKGTDIAGLS